MEPFAAGWGGLSFVLMIWAGLDIHTAHKGNSAQLPLKQQPCIPLKKKKQQPCMLSGNKVAAFSQKRKKERTSPGIVVTS
jgi:hypothetical protein